MRICYISYEYPPDTANGGIATYVEQAAKMMSARGHEVVVIAASPSRSINYRDGEVDIHLLKVDDRESFRDPAGVLFANLHEKQGFDLLEGPEFLADAQNAIKLVPAVPFVMKMHTPSVLLHELSSDNGFANYGRVLKRRAGSFVKKLVQQRKITHVSFARKHPGDIALYTREAVHARQADLILPPCEDLCRFAIERWDIPANRVRRSPYPYIPNARFLELKAPTKASVIGFVGRLERRKGIDDVANALRRVLRRHPAVRIKFVGAIQRHSSGKPYDQWILNKLGKYSERLQ